MPEVTRLERQEKNAERVNIYLDGEFAFGLNEMDAARLRIGQELTPEVLAELQHSDAIEKAVERAVNLLSYRPRSTGEIREKLTEKEIPEAAIDAAISKLTRLGYLDDHQFARFWVEDRLRNRPRGRRALQFELRQKGIADSLINEVLDDLLDESQAAYEAAESRVRRMRGATRQEFKQKVGAFLQRRGFGFEASNRALQSLIQDIEAEDEQYFTEPQSGWD
ncbi:MAG: RecX family transcriptional regulator, partial [Anaerolineae bacterium]|nr:RecX family transcriptional regulator [Anaerolineae bacterium]